MNFLSLAKVAVDLGVIPALALFAVAAMLVQNRRLIKMLDRREEANLEILKLLATQLVELKALREHGGSR